MKSMTQTTNRMASLIWVATIALSVGAGLPVPGAEAPQELSFDQYFTPYRLQIEPNAPGYPLPLDLETVTNLDHVRTELDLSDGLGRIEQNGFVVLERDFGTWDPNRDGMTGPYAFLKARRIPFFVTADTVLHLYHVQFDETLKDVEQREFIGDIGALTQALLDDALALHDQSQGDLEEAARRNVAYLAVAKRLIEPDAATPALVAQTVATELALIDAHEGFAESPLFLYEEDYSQYVPRGHYTRSEPLKRYFRTMMWYGRMAFLLKGSIPWGRHAEALISPYDADIQTLQALQLATSLRTVTVAGRSGLQVWDRLYGVTAFYVGLADDLTPYDYLGALDQVFAGGYALADLADAGNLLALRTELALLPSPQIYGGTGNATVPPGGPPEYIFEILDKSKGLRLMGQRFIPDSYMFQRLVFPQADAYTGDPYRWPFTKADSGTGRYVRGYPRGLDVMALLGSKQALHILIDEGDTDYVDFWARFGELKHEFDAFSVTDWNRNLYWSWLYALKALVTDLPQGYPQFMRTPAWQRRALTAALASWTELRHDTILYAKQSYTPVERGMPLPPPPGYIEPVPEFFGRLLALTQMTNAGLTDVQVLSEKATTRLAALEDLLARMADIASKELLNQPISQQDARFIEELANSLEALVTGVDAAGLKTTLVADVHTNIAEGQVVEEAVGRVDLLVVACPATDGSVFLAAGPALSYYEFKHPMADRLTDEAWRDLLDAPEAPARPLWHNR